MTGCGSPPARRSCAIGCNRARRFDGNLRTAAVPAACGRDARGPEVKRDRMEPIALNGRSYRIPTRPIVVICADGCDPSYIEAGLHAGMLPTVARWRAAGSYALAEAVMPTFTNPNNLSIVTGAPPSVHGISGNFALDRDSGAEIMMNDPEMVRGQTILGLMSQAGVAVAAITAKDKLRRMLGRGLDIGGNSICFSSEQADRCSIAEH